VYTDTEKPAKITRKGNKLREERQQNAPRCKQQCAKALNGYRQKQPSPGKCCQPYLDMPALLQAPQG